jgi:hypothetical protein
MKYSYLMNKSAFINAETLRILDSAHTYAPQGIGGHALQRRDSGRLYLRFFIVIRVPGRMISSEFKDFCGCALRSLR